MTDEEFENYGDKFMLNYAKAVISEMGLERAREFLELVDWLAAQKDLNEAIK